MKKIIIILMLIVSLSFISCSKDEEKSIKVLTPNGIPYVALAGVDNENGIEVDAKSSDNLSASFIKGDYDIIVAPINMGVKLYNANKTTYKLKAVITLSNTFIVSKNEINSINDLNGKNVLAFGKESVPGIMLDLLLKENNTVPNNIRYEASNDITVPIFMTSDEYDYLVVSEPALTNLKKKIDIKMLDLNEVIKTNNNLPLALQAAIFVNPNSDSKALNKALNKIEENINYLNANSKEYSEKIEKKDSFFETMTKNVIEESIPRSGIVFLDAYDNKTSIQKFIDTLYNYKKELTGALFSEEIIYK